MSDQLPARPMARAADVLRHAEADEELQAALQAAGDALETGDAGRATRMLVEHGGERLDGGAWKHVAEALLAEVDAGQRVGTRDPEQPPDPQASAVEPGEPGDSRRPTAGATDDPLVATLRGFAARLDAVADARARGELDARDALSQVKEGFHEARRALSAAQRDELRARLRPPG